MKHEITIYESGYIGPRNTWTVEHDGSNYALLRAMINEAVLGISFGVSLIEVKIVILEVE